MLNDGGWIGLGMMTIPKDLLGWAVKIGQNETVAGSRSEGDLTFQNWYQQHIPVNQEHQAIGHVQSLRHGPHAAGDHQVGDWVSCVILQRMRSDGGYIGHRTRWDCGPKQCTGEFPSPSLREWQNPRTVVSSRQTNNDADVASALAAMDGHFRVGDEDDYKLEPREKEWGELVKHRVRSMKYFRSRYHEKH